MPTERILNGSRRFQTRADIQQSLREQQRSSSRLSFSLLASLCDPSGNNPPEFLLSLHEGLQKGQNLKQAYFQLNEAERASLHKICDPRFLEKLFALSQEPQGEMLLSGFLDMGRSLKSQQEFESASLIFHWLKQNSSDFPEIQNSVAFELDAIQGRGAFGGRFEFLTQRFAKEAMDYRSIAPMFAGTALAGIVKTATLAKFAGMGEAWYSRGTTAKALAGFLAYAVEVPTFALSSRALRRLDAKGGAEPEVTDEFKSAAITLGLLKIAGMVGHEVFSQLHGINEMGVATRLSTLTKITQPLISQTAMFGGMLLGHKAEERWGLREHIDDATTVTDTLNSMLSMGVGAHLGEKVLGPGYARWNQEMELRTRAKELTENQRARKVLSLLRNPLLSTMWMALGAGGMGGGFLGGEEPAAKQLETAQAPPKAPQFSRHVKLEERTLELMEQFPEAARNLGKAGKDEPNQVFFALNHLRWWMSLIQRDAGELGAEAIIEGGKMFARWPESPEAQNKIEQRLRKMFGRSSVTMRWKPPTTEAWWRPFWEDVSASADPASSKILAGVLQCLEKRAPELAETWFHELAQRDIDRSIAVQELWEGPAFFFPDPLQKTFKASLAEISDLVQQKNWHQLNRRIAELHAQAWGMNKLAERMAHLTALHDTVAPIQGWQEEAAVDIPQPEKILQPREVFSAVKAKVEAGQMGRSGPLWFQARFGLPSELPEDLEGYCLRLLELTDKLAENLVNSHKVTIITILDKDPLEYAQLSHIYQNLGQHEKAEEFLRRAREIFLEENVFPGVSKEGSPRQSQIEQLSHGEKYAPGRSSEGIARLVAQAEWHKALEVINVDILSKTYPYQRLYYLSEILQRLSSAEGLHGDSNQPEPVYADPVRAREEFLKILHSEWGMDDRTPSQISDIREKPLHWTAYGVVGEILGDPRSRDSFARAASLAEAAIKLAMDPKADLLPKKIAEIKEGRIVFHDSTELAGLTSAEALLRQGSLPEALLASYDCLHSNMKYDVAIYLAKVLAEICPSSRFPKLSLRTERAFEKGLEKFLLSLGQLASIASVLKLSPKHGWPFDPRLNSAIKQAAKQLHLGNVDKAIALVDQASEGDKDDKIKALAFLAKLLSEDRPGEKEAISTPSFFPESHTLEQVRAQMLEYAKDQGDLPLSSNPTPEEGRRWAHLGYVLSFGLLDYAKEYFAEAHMSLDESTIFPRIQSPSAKLAAEELDLFEKGDFRFSPDASPFVKMIFQMALEGKIEEAWGQVQNASHEATDLDRAIAMSHVVYLMNKAFRHDDFIGTEEPQVFHLNRKNPSITVGQTADLQWIIGDDSRVTLQAVIGMMVVNKYHTILISDAGGGHTIAKGKDGTETVFRDGAAFGLPAVDSFQIGELEIKNEVPENIPEGAEFQLVRGRKANQWVIRLTESQTPAIPLDAIPWQANKTFRIVPRGDVASLEDIWGDGSDGLRFKVLNDHQWTLTTVLLLSDLVPKVIWRNGSEEWLEKPKFPLTFDPQEIESYEVGNIRIQNEIRGPLGPGSQIYLERGQDSNHWLLKGSRPADLRKTELREDLKVISKPKEAKNYFANLPKRDLDTIPEPYRHLIPKPKDIVLFPRFERILQETASFISAPERIAVRFFGPAGTAKTTIPEMIAEQMGTPLFRIPFSKRTDPSDMEGLWAMEEVNGEYVPVFKEGAATVAMEHGFHLVLDEPDLARPGTLAFINNVSAPGEFAWVRKGNGQLRRIKVHEGYRVYATENGVQEIGREEHGKDFIRRFVPYYVGPWSQEETAFVLDKLYGKSGEKGLWDRKFTQTLAYFHDKMRLLAEGLEDPETKQALPALGSGVGQNLQFTPRSVLRLAKRLEGLGALTPENLSRAIRAEYILPLADLNDRDLVWSQAEAIFSQLAKDLRWEVPQALQEKQLQIIQDLTDKKESNHYIGPDQIPIPTLQAISQKYLDGRKIPEGNFVFTDQALRIIDEILWNHSLGIDVMMLGDAGEGKTEIPPQIAKLLGMPYYPKTMSSETDEQDLVGGPGRVNGKVAFIPDIVTLGTMNGGVIHLDEYLLSDTGKLEAVTSPLMDATQALILKNPYQLIPRKKGKTLLLLTSNQPFGDYADRSEASSAAMSRVAVMYLTDDFAMQKQDRMKILRSWADRAVPEASLTPDAKKKVLNPTEGAEPPARRTLVKPALRFASQSALTDPTQKFFPLKIHPEVAKKFQISPHLELDVQEAKILELHVDGSKAPIGAGQREALKKYADYLTRRTQIEMAPVTGKVFKILYSLLGSHMADLTSKQIILNLLDLLGKPLDASLGAGKHEWAHATIDRPSEKYDAHEPGRLFANVVGDPRMNEYASSLRPDFARQIDALYQDMWPENYDEKEMDLFRQHLPHEQFADAIIYYWRYGKVMPMIENEKVKEALDKALPIVKPAFTLFPESTQDKDVDAAAKRFYQILDQAYPYYQSLIPESERELMDRLEKGEQPEELMQVFKFKIQASPKEDEATTQQEEPTLAKGPQRSPQDLQNLAQQILKQRAGQLADQFEPQDPAAFDRRKAEIARAQQAHGNEGQVKDGEDQSSSDTNPQPVTDKPLDEEAKKRMEAARRQALEKQIEQDLYRSKVPPSAILAVRKLKKVLPPDDPTYLEGFFSTGKRLDRKKATQDAINPISDGKVMLRRLRPGEHNANVVLLSDVSFSMNEPVTVDNALKASAAAIYLSDQLKLNFGEILFGSGFIPAKKLGKPLSSYQKKTELLNLKKQSFGDSSINGATNIREPLAKAIEWIREKKARSNFIILITDGQESGSNYPKTLGELQQEAKKEGIHLMVLAMGDAKNSVPAIFEHYKFVANDGSDIPDKIVELFSEAHRSRLER